MVKYLNDKDEPIEKRLAMELVENTNNLMRIALELQTQIAKKDDEIRKLRIAVNQQGKE